MLGDRFELSLSALEPTGRLVTCGALDSPQVSLNMWAVVGKRSRGGDAYEGRASAGFDGRRLLSASTCADQTHQEALGVAGKGLGCRSGLARFGNRKALVHLLGEGPTMVYDLSG